MKRCSDAHGSNTADCIYCMRACAAEAWFLPHHLMPLPACCLLLGFHVLSHALVLKSACVRACAAVARAGARGAAVAAQLRDAHRVAQPHDPVQGEGAQAGGCLCGGSLWVRGSCLGSGLMPGLNAAWLSVERAAMCQESGDGQARHRNRNARCTVVCMVVGSRPS